MRTINRKPSHPGEVLKELWLDELGITISKFAQDIGVSRKAVSAIVNCRKSITPEMALRLAKALDTTPEVWLNLQCKYDLWIAENKFNKEIAVIHTIRTDMLPA